MSNNSADCPIQCIVVCGTNYVSGFHCRTTAYSGASCVQSFDYFETENEEFLRQKSQTDPRVRVSEY